MKDPAAPNISLFDYDAAAPLHAEADAMDDDGEVRRTHYWIDGLAERVPVVVTAPCDDAGRRPALLIGHGASTRKDDPYVQLPARRWAKAGLVCVAADAPEHGERAEEPFDTQALFRRGPEAAMEFLRSHVIDHRRVLDLAVTLRGVDPGRIGYLGFSMGTMLGVPFVAVDDRVRCACFVIGGSLPIGVGEPARWAPLVAPRPVLQLNTVDDEIFGPGPVKALHDALGEPKELRMFPGTHISFGGEVFKVMWDFFRHNLAV